MFSNAVIFLIISTVIVIVGSTVIYSFSLSTVEKFKLILSYFAAISVLLVIYNLYINFEFNERAEKNKVSYNTITNIKNNFLDPQKQLLESFPEGYFLYASMNQDTDLKKEEPRNFDHLKRKQVEVYNAIRIFQCMEDFLTTGVYDMTGNYVWINNFLMWMQSSILQNYWSLLGFNFSTDTREMVLRIIEKSRNLIELRRQKGKLTTQDYDNISKKFEVHYR